MGGYLILRQSHNKANIALEILTRISEIYKIENDIRCYLPDKRLENRQQKSKSLIESEVQQVRP